MDDSGHASPTLDSGAKKVLLPISSAVDLGTVPPELVGSFNLTNSLCQYMCVINWAHKHSFLIIGKSNYIL